MFQGFNLLARTTALENVELPLVYAGVPARERRGARRGGAGRRWAWPTAPTTCPTSSPAGSSSAWPSRARWSTEPPLLLADEPTGNLDTQTSEEIMGILERLNAERGITVVLVTHEPDIAAYAKRVIVFRDGHDRVGQRRAPTPSGRRRAREPARRCCGWRCAGSRATACARC